MRFSAVSVALFSSVTASIHRKENESVGNDFFSDTIAPVGLQGLIIKIKSDQKETGLLGNLAAPILTTEKVEGDRKLEKDVTSAFPTSSQAPMCRSNAVNCFQLDDGSVVCFLENVPGNNFLTLFFNCPTAAGSTLLDCQTCTIVQENCLEDIDENDRVCNSCQICSETIALDCSNLADGECSIQNCDGECAKPKNPTESPTSAAASSVKGVLWTLVYGFVAGIWII